MITRQTLCNYINLGAGLTSIGLPSEALAVFYEALNLITIGITTPGILREGPTYMPLAAHAEIALEHRPEIGYCKLFTISINAEPNHFVTEKDIVFCTAVTHFNIAISLQLKQGVGYRQKALILYKKSLEMITTAGSDFGRSISLSRLAVAVLHNMALLLFDDNDFGRAQDTIGLMQHILGEPLRGYSTIPLFERTTEREIRFTSYLVPFGASLVNSAPAA